MAVGRRQDENRKESHQEKVAVKESRLESHSSKDRPVVEMARNGNEKERGNCKGRCKDNVKGVSGIKRVPRPKSGARPACLQ